MANTQVLCTDSHDGNYSVAVQQIFDLSLIDCLVLTLLQYVVQTFYQCHGHLI